MSDAPGHSKETARLPFSVREGATPLPSRLALREISQELRAYIWQVIYSSLEEHVHTPEFGGYSYLTPPWSGATQLLHVHLLHLPADEYQNRFGVQRDLLKKQVYSSDYLKLFDFLEFLLRLRLPQTKLEAGFVAAFKHARAAYEVLPHHAAIFPVATEQEGAAVVGAITEAEKAGLSAVSTQLLAAGRCLNVGDFAGCIRESIHSIETVCRLLVPGSTALGPALAALEKNGHLHRALKAGFAALYGFSSDEEGIRHPLIEKKAAGVDQEDAVFMLGACAAFVSYLINKGRRAALLK